MFPSLCQGRSTSQELPDDKRNGKLGVQVLCQSYRMGLPACCLCQAYELIRADDPNAVALPIRLECLQCLKHENDIRAVREAEIAQAAREQVREAFSSQYKVSRYAHAIPFQASVRLLMRRPDTRNIVLVDYEWNYILPAAFRTAWQEFVKDPIHKMRPSLTNEEFFCQHDRINIDVNYNPDLSADRIISLLPSRWAALTQMSVSPVMPPP